MWRIGSILVRLTVAAALPLGVVSGALAEDAHIRCDSCHDAGSGEAAVETGFFRCGGCHAPSSATAARLERELPGHFAVVPADAGGGPTVSPGSPSCGTCHDPHRAGAPNLLREPDEDARPVVDGRPDPGSMLCLECHPQHGRWRGGAAGSFGRHPVGITVPRERLAFGAGLEMPLADARGTPDPADDVIACVTCHDVHASRNAHLLRWAAGDSRVWCTACHPVGGSPRGGDLLAWRRSHRRPQPASIPERIAGGF